MTTTRPTPAHATNAIGGFALVGVVMFVLVLTILGLSLFSLSTIEGQFLNKSNSSAEAFYAASEGIERARFVLATTGSLSSVKTWVTGGAITNVVAKQGNAFADAESLANVVWNGQDIWIRVLAVQRGQRSLLEARFRPAQEQDLYRRLLTVSNEITVAPVNPDGLLLGQIWPTLPQTVLNGPVWTNGSPAWQAAPGFHTYPPPPGVVPQPEVASYISSHWVAASAVTANGAGTYVLNAGFLSTGFFKTVGSSGGWSLEDNFLGSPSIAVSGKVVWLIPQGARFDHTVNVTGLPTDALIIVAGKNALTSSDDAFKGIAFKSAINSPIVPVILVSDGTVAIEHKVDNATGSSTVPFMSVYARDVYLLGPHNFGNPTFSRMQLNYPAGPVADALLDLLYNLGVLPNMSAGSPTSLPPVAGTWRDLTESNPS